MSGWGPLCYADADAQLARCNSYTRLPTLIDMSPELEFADWLKLLGDWWSLCDNVGEWADHLMDLTPLGYVLDAPAALRPALMTDLELAQLEALPDPVTVWRGCYASNKWGLSWSTDRETAERFPTLARYRQEGQPLLVKAVVAKQDIIALKLDRNEAEIVAWRPKHISTSHLRI